MTKCSLTLYPYGKQAFTIGLLENDGRQGALERIIEHSSGNNNNIFSDLSYEFQLNCEDLSQINDVRVYINDAFESSTYSNGHICFPGRGASDRRIFSDCYGFVELSLTLIYSDGQECTLSSEYLPVLVRRGELNDSVKAMVNFVYNNQESLLLNGEPKPRNPSGLKESGYRSLAAQILLAEEIAAIYESSYGYFKANSRFRLEKTPVVERLERVQHVTQGTLSYAATHPEHLRQVNSTMGIRIGQRVYQPQKVETVQNICSYDIYENRVVLGFLRTMIDSVQVLQERCDNLLNQIPNDEDYSPEYIYSSFFMFSETRKMLEDGKAQLGLLYEKFTNLWGMYCNALPIPIDQYAAQPRPTAIFMSVPQYNRIFVRIHRWYSFGIYDFTKENFMLSFIKISALYESYLLTKLLCYFKDRGYLLNSSKRCIYPVSKRWKYKNTSGVNTFVLLNAQKTITLYYQPVIFDTDQSSINGIGLYRNNSIPVFTGDEDDGRQGGHYYVPDFLIKVEENGQAEYMIVDAKFSDINSVRRHYVKDLAFKYLFSISPITENEKVSGLCIMYGKCTATEQLQTAYDKRIVGSEIHPFTETLPLMEGMNNSGQYEKLDRLMKKIL